MRAPARTPSPRLDGDGGDRRHLQQALPPQHHSQRPTGPGGQSPEENTEVAVFLASPAASYITGQTFAVDGGMSYTGMTCQSLQQD
ncbi:TPA: SDR family oxidoreductase [Pseudomonas aeruginosa]|nr:SDR family oxidoreductase [Pseudomonas aeruginosa]QPZ63061.1 SDR family oxidoreductase [Pseudomonas aeruginosa]HBO3954666.1 SDR family oxidoreductase [Pseudomonas aeruginosa]